jgi:hypothetical protein
MKKWILPALGILMAISLSVPQMGQAQEGSLEAEEAAAEKTKDRPEWQSTLKTQYHLTDEQIKSMQDQGLSFPQMAMTSALAEKSGKPLADVLKMRTEDKMGWGKIANELGVEPKEIGQSVAAVRHEMRDEKRALKEEKKQNKREERLARKESKRSEKSNKAKH